MLLPSSMSEWVGPRCGHVIYFFIHESTATVSLGLLVVEISTLHWHTALGRTPLDERSARRTDLYPKRHKTVKTQTSIPPAGFEPAIRASERTQTHALDRAATGIGSRFTQAGWKQVTCQTYEKSRGDRMCAEPKEQYDRWCFCLWYTFYTVHHIFVWRAILDKPVLSSSFGWSRSEITHRPAWTEIKFFLQLRKQICPLNAELNTICPSLALFRAHHILHIIR